MSEKMDAYVKAKPEFNGTEMQRVDVPKPKHNEVLIKNKVVSICGTDVHIYNWDDWSHNRIKVPRIYGHEFGGEIIEIGKNVEGFEVGDDVSAECHLACGHCFQCRTGNAHICENGSIFGVDVDGIFAEYSAIPVSNVWKNPPDLPPDYASIQDPLGNAVHTVFSADIPGRNVAILGCGPIGLMSVAICKAIGASKIFALGRKNEYRMNLAKELGAHTVLKSGDDAVKTIIDETDGRGVDVVLEFAGTGSAVSEGFKILRKGGQISLLGIYPKPFEIDFTNEIVFKYRNVTGINGRLMFDNWYRMQGLIRENKLQLDKIITHRFKFEEFQKAMETMRSGNSGKVVLDLK